MWFLLSRRVRAYVFLALGAPLLAWLLDALGQRLETRRGPTRASRVLRWGGRKLRRRSRGPLAHHGDTHQPVDTRQPSPDPPDPYAATGTSADQHMSTPSSGPTTPAIGTAGSAQRPSA